ncbi:NPP1 domain-containing protein [Colletotrichum orchidophilum]|uniref:NPP1 domain-containing protein n=1 Tax=Colletotrichum orchidophilum TaxID=1209926 RepID=A0A1G4B7C1_9PEZI|nr:NPP1 domain-containing protein [Colletotrichum orchidophilum]OHE97236.1 NPP1 domain-containing protein [Colletotrichum orchidophilum]
MDWSLPTDSGRSDCGDDRFGQVYIRRWRSQRRVQIHHDAISPFIGGDLENVFERTLVGRLSLPDIAQQVLSDVKDEKTEVPLTYANFQSHLGFVYRESFYGVLEDDQSYDDGNGVSLSSPPEIAKDTLGAARPTETLRI